MKENEFKVVGVKHGEKEGKQNTTLYLETPFESFEASSDRYQCEGLKVATEYFFNHVDVKLGDVIEILYRKNSFTGKAMAAGVTVVVPAGKK